jgi:hypothetical protein
LKKNKKTNNGVERLKVRENMSTHFSLIKTTKMYNDYFYKINVWVYGYPAH